MGSGSSTAQQLNLPSGLTPVTPQNAQSVMQGDMAQAQQGNPMGLYNFPLQTILGMTDPNWAANLENPTPAPTPQSSPQPVDNSTVSAPQNNVQPFFTPSNSGLDINQFVNSDGTAAPLGAQPNFVNQNQPPPWTSSQNNFSGIINGVPTQTGSMLNTNPPKT